MSSCCEFKLCHFAANATHNISIAWGVELARELTMCHWFQKFIFQDEAGCGCKLSHGNKELRAAHSERNTQTFRLKLSLAHKRAKRKLVTQIGRVKKVLKWVDHDLAEDQHDLTFVAIYLSFSWLHTYCWWKVIFLW